MHVQGKVIGVGWMDNTCECVTAARLASLFLCFVRLDMYLVSKEQYIFICE